MVKVQFEYAPIKMFRGKGGVVGEYTYTTSVPLSEGVSSSAKGRGPGGWQALAKQT